MNAPAAGQRWDAEAYARNGRFVAEHGASLIGWLQPQPGERVLDLGCGDGALSLQLVERGAAVVGFDASPELVAAAQARGLDARIGDAHALPFAAEFDAVFSNAALHWMRREPDTVLRGVARALKPGGRFVGEMGAAGNVAAIRAALHAGLARRGIDAATVDPWYFPEQAEYRARLERAGFVIQRIETFERPTPLPGSVDDWLRTFAAPFLGTLPEAERESLIAAARDALRPRLFRNGLWIADYVRLRFLVTRQVN